MLEKIKDAAGSARKLGTTLYLSACILVLSAIAACATVTDGLGGDGGPAASDYLSAGQGFEANIAPILLAILPLLLLMLAVWQGPAIIKRLVKSFSHG